MTQEEALELLQKYLAGKTDESETGKVEEWYGSLPVTDPLPAGYKKLIAENMRAHIKEAMRERDTKTNTFYRPWIKVAALLFMLSAFGLIFRKINNSAEVNSRALMVYTNSHERKEVTLSDGSVVTMEPSSRMIYPAKFPSATRTVKLISGEAFFSVAHEIKRPFKVCLSSHVQVKVLGTSFRIHDNSNEEMLRITVATGKVAVQKGKKTLGTLIRGQELSFHKKTDLASVSAAIHPNIVKLSFEGSTLAEVILKMEYVYSISIQVDNPEFLKLKCRAEFNSGQQPAEILDILCSLHQLRFSQSNDHRSFKIYP